MQVFENCICIAQARVIAGNRKQPHVCTIAFHEDSNSFLRFCLPFDYKTSKLLRRWEFFSVECSKENLENDNRLESWYFGRVISTSGVLPRSRQSAIHRRILSCYKYESELNEDRLSIGLMIPEPGFKIQKVTHPPGSQKWEKENHKMTVMRKKGLWYPPFDLRVKGYRFVDGQRKSFDKKLIAWDVFEAIRSGRSDPIESIKKYRNPYFIIGNLVAIRNAFMIVGVLSAPDRAIEENAIHNQLRLVP